MVGEYREHCHGNPSTRLSKWSYTGLHLFRLLPWKERHKNNIFSKVADMVLVAPTFATKLLKTGLHSKC